MRDYDDDDDYMHRGRYRSPEELLWQAVRRDDVAGAEKLLADDKDINLKCRYEEKTLVYCAIKEENYAMAETLLKAGAEVNTPSCYMEFTPLILACDRGDEKALDLLAKYNADVNARTRTQETGLHRAAWHGHNAVIRKLVDELGCDVNAQDYMKNTALFCAVSSNLPETIRTLMELGANPDLIGSNGFSALTPRAFADTIRGADDTHVRTEVAEKLDDPEMRAAGIRYIYDPATRKTLSVGKPLTLKKLSR
jgi:ankyrin repeat protein